MSDKKMQVAKLRWLILSSSFFVMMIISIYQYSWFLFAHAFHTQLKWNLANIGLTFTIFTYSATFIQPLSGFLADSYGPKKVAIVAALLVGTGFILASMVNSPPGLYLFYGIGGLGVGVLYGISIACAVKWFPEKRGFATGLVVFGFGAGTAIFNLLIEKLLMSKGLSTTFFYLGIGMIIILLPLSLFYEYPQRDRMHSFDHKGITESTSIDFKPFEMLRTYQWFLIYFSFIVTVSVVLIFGAQMKMLADEFDIPASYFKILIVLFPIGNGLSRIFAGSISDIMGREKTMMIFYAALSLSIFAFIVFAHILPIFMLTVFVAALLGGAPFALYPATVADYYGPKHSTTNYGVTYTAKAWAGLISGWLSGYLVMKFGSYKFPLIIVGFCSLIAALISNPKLMKAPKNKKILG